MKMTFDVEPDTALLKVNLEGDYPADNLAQVLSEVRESQIKHNSSKILIHALAVDAPQTEFQRYATGERLSATFGNHVKVAIVYPAELITKFTENVAVNRGAFLKIVPTEEEALNWLLSDEA